MKGKHCFSLIRYGFCSSNALYSASLPFRMFIFLLTPFDTSDCYYFKINLSQVLLVKVLLTKKACNIVFWSSKNEEITLPQEFTFVFIQYFNGTILLKNSCQKQVVLKKYKKWGCPSNGATRIVSERGVQTFCKLN